MRQKAAITVDRSREDVQRLWADSAHRPSSIEESDAVTFVDAPGERGTEIHVDLEHRSSAGRVGELVQAMTGSVSLARVKDDLRRFKQQVETGEIARSDSTPEGESIGRKPRQRPAQPLTEPERQEVGV
jgi:uncharacterized membrane protein